MSSDGEPSGFEVLQHSSTYCAGVDGSSTAVIALLKQRNVLEVCARARSCIKSLMTYSFCHVPDALQNV